MTEWLDLTVARCRQETAAIRFVELKREHGAPLPAWSPGAHVKVRLPDGDTRSYSLINFSSDPAATSRPAAYGLGIRLENPSRGGSTFMHGLSVGDRVSVAPPSNDFVLEPSSQRFVLVAGGIGVTPIIGMAAHLAAAGNPFRLHYLARSADHMAFRTELAAIAGDRMAVHLDDQDGVFDLRGLMSELAEGEPLYLCGPRPMIDAAIAEASRFGWAPGRLHFEIFSAALPQAGDRAFEVVLQSSGQTLTVPADRTILDVMIEAGLDPLYDCKRGDCGICQATVVEGEPDHRDYILSDAEKAAGELIQICVSRSKTPRLVLDL